MCVCDLFGQVGQVAIDDSDGGFGHQQDVGTNWSFAVCSDGAVLLDFTAGRCRGTARSKHTRGTAVR